MKKIFVQLCLLIMVFSGVSIPLLSKCQSIKADTACTALTTKKWDIKKYSLPFFNRNGVNLKTYQWNNELANCNINKAELNHRKDVGFTIGGGVALGLGIGLLSAGLYIISPTEIDKYKLGRTFVLAGIATSTVAVPLFLFRSKFKNKAQHYLTKMPQL